jgi:hypothetical protein
MRARALPSDASRIGLKCRYRMDSGGGRSLLTEASCNDQGGRLGAMVESDGGEDEEGSEMRISKGQESWLPQLKQSMFVAINARRLGAARRGTARHCQRDPLSLERFIRPRQRVQLPADVKLVRYRRCCLTSEKRSISEQGSSHCKRGRIT